MLCMDKMIGKKYGRWTVLERVPNKNKKIYYKAICDCGTIRDVRKDGLTSGKSRSCGCAPKNTISDEAGNRYNRWTIIKRVENNYKGDAMYLAKCDCGTEKIIRGSSVRLGESKSCGCLQKEAIEKLTINEEGNRYGRLKVIEKAEKPYKREGVFWLCKCDCGTETIVRADQLRSGGTMSCGCLQSKGEFIIAELLSKNKIQYKKEYTFDDLRGVNGGLLRFDFAIFSENKLSHLVEYDGIQHYAKDGDFYKENTQTHDVIKNSYCKKHNIPLIRLSDYSSITLEQLLNKQGC